MPVIGSENLCNKLIYSVLQKDKFLDQTKKAALSDCFVSNIGQQEADYGLPVHQPVDEFSLLAAGALEIEAGGLDVLVAEEVGQKGDVVVPLEEVLGVEVPERVGMDDGRVDTELDGVILEPLGDTPRRDGIPVGIQEEEAAILP